MRECGTDQGTEKGINNIANVHVPSVLEAIRRVQGGAAVAHEPDTASAGFLFPFSLWFGDHLHMIFGTLEEAVASLDNWSGEFETMLQDFSEFMNPVAASFLDALPAKIQMGYVQEVGEAIR